MSVMRENLIGYLLDALEPTERATVEAQLARDSQLKDELDILSRSLEPLAADKAPYAPPVGLATRTLEFVAVQAKVQPPPPVNSVPSRWSMADMLVAAGIFLAATMLFWPAMNQSRFAARVRGCQNNLRQIGTAMTSYSDFHGRQFPAVTLSNARLNRGGMYAVMLNEKRLLPGTYVVLCPASPLAEEADDFNVPTQQELLAASDEEAARMIRRMGGAYGYSLGFYIKGRYQPPTDLGRSTHALMADAPSGDPSDRFSSNHGRCGQNVLFEDMHVKYLTTCRQRECEDHIFENEKGQMHAGLHPDDTVVGTSDAIPVLREVDHNTILESAQ
jgi:hypothetical protein